MKISAFTANEPQVVGLKMGTVHITSWYPNFNGSHFGLPPSFINRMTGLGGNLV